MTASKATKRMSKKFREEIEQEIAAIRALLAQAKADLARANALLAKIQK